MRTKNAILFLLLGALGAAWAGPLQKVGFESKDGACRAWWQFDAKGALPSYFARVTDGGKGVEAGFAGVEWDEAVQAPATAGVARARVVVRESAGKRVAVFQIKPQAPVAKIEKSLKDGRFSVAWSCPAEKGSWTWPAPAKAAAKPEAKPAPAPEAKPAPKPEAKPAPAPAPEAKPAPKAEAKPAPAPAPEAKPAPKPEAKPAPAPAPEAKPAPKQEAKPEAKPAPKPDRNAELEEFYQEISRSSVSGKSFVLQGQRRLVVNAPKSLLFAKPDRSSAVVRKLNVGDTLFSNDRRGEWYVVDDGDRSAYVPASEVKRLEEVTSADEAQLRKLVNRQISRMQDGSGNVSLRENELGVTKEVTIGETRAPGDTGAVAPSKAPKQRYSYSSFGRRDPFVPFEEPEIEGLSIDEVQLVGIIWDSETPLAIFEDVRLRGVSYTLREGDEVVNGNVYKITKDEVVFLLTEFGVSRKFSMTLPKIIE